MNLLFLIVVICALFLNTNIGKVMGFTNPTAVAFSPMALYLTFALLTRKIHYNKIATYLLILAVIILLCKWSIGQNYIVLIGQLLVVPMLIFICFDRLTTQQSSTLRRLMILFFILVCALAIVERALNYHFFPVNVNPYYLRRGYFRSYSFFVHPLIGAYFVTIFMSFLSIVHFKRKKNQIFLFFLGYLSLFCFDGRTAILVATFILFPYFFWKVYKTSGKNRWIIILGVICMLLGLLYLISETSFGSGRFMTARLMDESGQTRLDVFNFYKYYNKRDDMIWGSPDNIQYMAEKLGAGGVENGIVVFVLEYGIIFAPILLLLLFLLQYQSLSIYTTPDKLMLLFVFWGLGSTNPNLSAPISWALWIFVYYAFKSTHMPIGGVLVQRE